MSRLRLLIGSPLTFIITITGFSTSFFVGGKTFCDFGMFVFCEPVIARECGRMRTPEKPGQHLRPKGVMRQRGDQIARNAMTQQRVNIANELESIQKHMDKRKDVEKTKAKTI